ncbi:MAG: urease accessory protein UreE [Synechococcaceae cyanobacterium SM2_3_1]|nr:urease accessory protein UreE [Synechococcaceae cyanobacterium SM2_3_1]
MSIPSRVQVHALVSAPDLSIPWQETVTLSWADRQRVRQRVHTDRGTEVLLALPRGRSLRQGDVLYQDQEGLIKVVAELEPVVLISGIPIAQLCRVAHQLGNWHRPIQLTESGSLMALVDEPLQAWLSLAQIPFAITHLPFEPTLTGHHHSHP